MKSHSQASKNELLGRDVHFRTPTFESYGSSRVSSKVCKGEGESGKLKIYILFNNVGMTVLEGEADA